MHIRKHIYMYIHTYVHIYTYIYGSPPPIDPSFFGLYNKPRQDSLSISRETILWVQGYISSFSHTMGRARLKSMPHLFKFKSRLKSKIEDCRL